MEMADSPGSCACTYSLLDLDTNIILHMEIVNKREVSLQSPNIERKAVSQAVKYLQDNGITIRELATDASSAVRKLLGTLYLKFKEELLILHISYRSS